jgi:hypothetical protein
MGGVFSCKVDCAGSSMNFKLKELTGSNEMRMGFAITGSFQADDGSIKQLAICFTDSDISSSMTFIFLKNQKQFISF